MKVFRWAMTMLSAISLAACISGPAPTLEITRLAPQTLEVTRLVPQTAIITRTPKPTAIPYALDTGYYEGMVVITQYYTLLGHGLHKEAYQLLSSRQRAKQKYENFVIVSQRLFEIVEIIIIKPLPVEITQRGGHAQSDPEGEKRFYVNIRGWGSDVHGKLMTLFLAIIQEQGEWKIDVISDMPFIFP